jgi:hypothetical protein
MAALGFSAGLTIVPQQYRLFAAGLDASRSVRQH